MTHIGHYQSPLGDILIATDEIGVYGLWFENQKYYASGLKAVSYTHLTLPTKRIV